MLQFRIETGLLSPEKFIESFMEKKGQDFYGYKEVPDEEFRKKIMSHYEELFRVVRDYDFDTSFKSGYEKLYEMWMEDLEIEFDERLFEILDEWDIDSTEDIVAKEYDAKWGVKDA